MNASLSIFLHNVGGETLDGLSTELQQGFL
jgi:hypothetical protein